MPLDVIEEQGANGVHVTLREGLVAFLDQLSVGVHTRSLRYWPRTAALVSTVYRFVGGSTRESADVVTTPETRLAFCRSRSIAAHGGAGSVRSCRPPGKCALSGHIGEPLADRG